MSMAKTLQSVFWPPQNLLFLLLLVVGPFLLKAANPLYHFCGNNGNYTSNSPYNESLSSFLSSVSTDNSVTTGFYNFSTGQSPDIVNALALCRGDVSLSHCRACLNDSSVTIIQRCPVQKEAIIWYDNCMLRYSNRSILGDAETDPAFYMWNVNNATSVEEFNQALRGLMDKLRISAAAGNSTRKFAVGSTTGPSFYTIYGLAQCTPNLLWSQCDDCLGEAYQSRPREKIGGRWLGPSCNIRFETDRFYSPSAEAPPPPTVVSPVSPPSPTASKTSPPPPTKGKSHNTARTVIIVGVPIAATCLLVGILYFCCWRARKLTQNFETIDEIRTAESLQYDFATVRTATNNFSEENILGQGGFGAVYKGKLDGQDLAVKRLSRGHGQGDQEFKTEVLLVARLQHRNLVRLLGFCLSGDERLLIYEFVPNSSLDRFIFDPVRRQQLTWETRQNIIGGIARGLVYLHQDSRLRIVHRDLKAGNILLEEDMTPKIADFGTARLSAVDDSHTATSRIVGTYGYMAPEYALYGKFSLRSDVFSFGVLVLEIVSGRRNICSQNGVNVEDLLTSVWRNWSEGMVSNIIDPLLKDGLRSEILRYIHIGLLCIQENAANRPTMATVLLMLNSFSISLPVPSQPALYMQSNIYSSLSFSATSHSTDTRSDASKSKSSQASVNKSPITDLHPR